MKSTLLVLAGLFLFELSLSPSIARQGPATNPGWQPFETIAQSALPIVSVRLNGSEGYRVVIDPTVREVLLDSALVAGIGLELVSRGETATIDYYGYEEEVPVAYLDLLEIGDVAVRSPQILLIEGDDATGLGGIRSYGRVGLDFLGPFRLTVYYPRNLFLLEPSPKDEVPAGGVPFDNSHRFISVEARVNGSITGRFIVDPGASATVIDRKWAYRHKLSEKGARGTKLPSVEIGGFRVEEVPALLGEMEKLPYGGKPAGVLGANLLLDLAVTYDFPRGLLWLRKVTGG